MTKRPGPKGSGLDGDESLYQVEIEIPEEMYPKFPNGSAPPTQREQEEYEEKPASKYST